MDYIQRSLEKRPPATIRLMTKQYPIEDWEFVEEIETSFNDWFYGNHTEWTWTVEWFAGDCSVEDPKTREDLMRKWIYASFYEGFMRGKYGKIEEEVENDNK
jgi:hypothetical protein